MVSTRKGARVAKGMNDENRKAEPQSELWTGCLLEGAYGVGRRENWEVRGKRKKKKVKVEGDGQ
jgi:hypothetical protein